MGAGNVKEAYVLWSHLPHAPFRLLCFMAVVAKDDDPRFWQGQEACALALGMAPDADAKTRQAAFRGVRRHIETLVGAKCIERTHAGSPGRNAEYALRLSIERRTLTVRQTEDAQRPPSDVERRTLGGSNGGRSAAQWRTLGDTMADAHRPPEEEQDVQDLRTGRSITERRSVPRARGRARTRDEQQPMWPVAVDSDRCPACRTDHSGMTCAEYRNGDDTRRRRA